MLNPAPNKEALPLHGVAPPVLFGS